MDSFTNLLDNVVQPWWWSRRSIEVSERIGKTSHYSTKRTKAHHRHIAIRGDLDTFFIPLHISRLPTKLPDISNSFALIYGTEQDNCILL